MNSGCPGADGVNREERVDYPESKGNHEVYGKETSIGPSFYFITHGKFLFQTSQKILLFLA